MSDELDRLRRARPSVPPPSRHARQSAQARLDERIAHEFSLAPSATRGRPGRRGRRRGRGWPLTPPLATAAWAAASLLVVAIVAGAFLLLGPSHQGSAPANSTPASAAPARGSLKAQALELWGPAATFYASITPLKAKAIAQAPKLAGQRISACQAPYLHHLDSGTVTSDIAKVNTIDQDAEEMEAMEAAVQVASPQLRVATRAWAQLTLANPTMQGFSRGLADQINASLNAPHIDACRFVRQIVAHGYSLAWTQASHDGRLATAWWATVLRAGKRQGMFWPWLQNGAIGREHLLTVEQQKKLTAMPGEIS
ncbi:MAG TPA: hypothetical protein VMF14_00300 [Solirubrobacteraceae bacterium]|nr:hypothetical protein [Solirubrobacteraceae bacterium]